MKTRFLSAALAALAVCASPAVAQPLPPSIADTAPLAGVQPSLTPLPPPIDARVSDLERENIQLKARVSALEKGKTDAPPAKGETADRWTHPNYPGVVFTKAQLSGMFPGITFNTSAAPVVARTTAPFDNCPDNCKLAGCAEGCSTTPTTPVIAAATPGVTLTYGLGRSGAGFTNTGAGCAGTSGITSGCSTAGCSAGLVGNVRGGGGWYLGKNLGR